MKGCIPDSKGNHKTPGWQHVFWRIFFCILSVQLARAYMPKYGTSRTALLGPDMLGPGMLDQACWDLACSGTRHAGTRNDETWHAVGPGIMRPGMLEPGML